MNIGKPRKLGRTIRDIGEGDSLSLAESIEDKDLLLCLGLTDGANPSCIQHDYARRTECEKPIVSSVMLIGIITSAVSKHLPGPGSHIVNFSVNFVEPVFHYGALAFQLEVIEVNKIKGITTISVEVVSEQEDRVLDAVVMVQPPQVTISELTEEEGALAYE